ncbi:hypothetical protein GCM10023319_20140 [Nocardia iowensis]
MKARTAVPARRGAGDPLIDASDYFRSAAIDFAATERLTTAAAMQLHKTVRLSAQRSTGPVARKGATQCDNQLRLGGQ